MIWQFPEQAIREQNSNKVWRHSQQSHSWLLLAKQNPRTTIHPGGTLEISPDTMSGKALFFNMALCLTPVLQNNRVQPGKRPLSSLLPTIVVPVWSKCGIYAAISTSGGQQSLSVITQVWLCYILKVWVTAPNDSPWLIYWQRRVWIRCWLIWCPSMKRKTIASPWWDSTPNSSQTDLMLTVSMTQYFCHLNFVFVSITLVIFPFYSFMVS